MVTKANLAREIGKSAGLPYRQASLCADIMLDTIATELSNGKKIALHGLGTFSVCNIAARQWGMNGGGVIPAHGRIQFRPCQQLRRKVWNCKHEN